MAESPLYGLGSGNVSFLEVKVVHIVKYVTYTKELKVMCLLPIGRNRTDDRTDPYEPHSDCPPFQA